MGPPAQVDLVTRAAGIAVPPNQGSGSSLLEAVAAPLVQEVPVMRGLDIARRADPSDSSGSDSLGEHLTRRRSRWVPRREVAMGWGPEVA